MPLRDFGSLIFQHLLIPGYLSPVYLRLFGSPPHSRWTTPSVCCRTQVTEWPISAKQTAATKPTYPDPTTHILICFDTAGPPDGIAGCHVFELRLAGDVRR
jgi:hypothetical protein